MVQGKEKETGKVWNWVIRNKENKLMGSIGLLGREFFGNPQRDVLDIGLEKNFGVKEL